MSERDRVLEVLRQGAARRARELAAAAAAAAPGDGGLGLSFTPGDRVFDRVTGETGIVIGGNRQTFNAQPSERENG
jgi:hypothetical protein